MATLRDVLEKYTNTDVRVSSAEYGDEAISDITFDIDEMLAQIGDNDLDREVRVARPDEGEDQSFRFIWFRNNDETREPDYMLHNVPRPGAPDKNRHAAKGKYPRRMVSLSGFRYDSAIDRLLAKGITEPSNKEILDEMTARPDWNIFKFYAEQEQSRSPEEIEREKAERSELSEYRADYQWIKTCETLDIETLRQIIAEGPYVPREDGSQPSPEDVSEPFRALHPKRHRQAQIVLEARVTGYDPLAPRIC